MNEQHEYDKDEKNSLFNLFHYLKETKYKNKITVTKIESHNLLNRIRINSELLYALIAHIENIEVALSIER